MALLDAMLCSEWEFRYFSFDAHWDVGEKMGSIRNGLGDEVFALFTASGCFIKEFYHESPKPQKVYDPIPAALKDATQEPAFSPENTTACYWKTGSSDRWTMNGHDGRFDPDVSFLLALVDGRPETYQSFSEDYHECVLPSSLVERIFQQQILTAFDLESVALDGSLDDLKKEIVQIGYPNDL